METNKSIAITGENNLPELIQDKFGNTKVLDKNLVYHGISAKEASEAVKKVMLLKKNENLR